MIDLKILQNSGEPIYQQISEQFKADILAGKIKQGIFITIKKLGEGSEDQRYHHDEGI